MCLYKCCLNVMFINLEYRTTLIVREKEKVGGRPGKLNEFTRGRQKI